MAQRPGPPTSRIRIVSNANKKCDLTVIKKYKEKEKV